MIRNHLKLVFRNLWYHKAQSFILVGGLTIGMTACILLLQYVNFELSFDNFHDKQDRIYRVVNERIQEGKTVQKGTITYPTIGPTMLKEFPEVINATRLAYSSNVMITKNNQVNPVEPGLWVDEHFLEIFDFEVLAKEDLMLLNEPNELVLTRHLADRYFPAAKGDYQSILGQEMQIDRDEHLYKIVGVIEDVPANSSLQFEILGSYASFIRYTSEGANSSWTWSDFYHYIELAPEANVDNLAAKLPAFSERHFRGTEVSGSEEIFSLQPLAEAHLYSENLEYEIGTTANGKAVWSLLIIAFFILILAWINYVNLSSVKAIERSKEVGVRKVIGASRFQLIRQFLIEAASVNLISLIFALTLTWGLTPWFGSNFGVDIDSLKFWSLSTTNIYLFLFLFSLIVLGVLFSGAYPAYLLSSPQISNVIKGIFTKHKGGETLRKVLVVFQFTMSIALIVGTWLVTKQINYMTDQDLGFKVEQIMTLNPPEMTSFDSTFIDEMNVFKSELAQISGVESASTSSRSPGQGTGRIFQIEKTGAQVDGQFYTANFINVDFEYAKTYGLTPTAGRFFRVSDHNLDWAAIDKMVVTEAGVKMLGYTNKEDIINQKFNFWNKNWEVIGVIPDFHQRSLHHNIEPMVFIPTYDSNNLLSLRLSTQNIDQTIAQIQALYKDFFPGNTFYYQFLDENFKQLYEADLRFGKILSFFTFLTIIIACLGLFGLASYSTFLRTKEIGIRKILGASTMSITALLSKDFLKLVIIATLTATPIAWYFIQQWLTEFAYHIHIQWWIFAISGLLAIAIALLTISAQSIKAALSNPIQSLRNE